MDLPISFLVLNSFWWTKHLTKGNKCGYKVMQHMWAVNKVQLIATGLWTILKDIWIEATSNQNNHKFGQPQLKKGQTMVQFSLVSSFFWFYELDL